MRQEVRFGEGSVGEIGRVLDSVGAPSVFLVTGASSCRVSGAGEHLSRMLAGRETTVYDGSSVSTEMAALKRGVALCRETRPAVVLAVGGGSAIDAGKLIGICSRQSCTPEETVFGLSGIEFDGPPVIAVPTTAGSGSEATHFAVFRREAEKYSVAHRSMLPVWAVIDPRLTVSMPRDLAAATGLDAFSQAVESLWSVLSNGESTAYAGDAVRLVLDNLEESVKSASMSARSNMCRASHLAGKAINISRTTAPHALSYTLTSRYGVPHGHAAALTLAPLLLFNAAVTEDDVVDPRGAAHVRKVMRGLYELLGCGDVEESAARITGLIRSLGLPTRLREVGVSTAADINRLAEEVNTERLANNPRSLDLETMSGILSAIQ